MFRGSITRAEADVPFDLLEYRRRRGIAPGNPPAKKRKNWLSDIFEMGE